MPVEHGVPKWRPTPVSLAPQRPADTGHPAPFFIVGASRSGTTLLRAILANHSGITLPWETWFILDLVRQLPIDDVLDQSDLRRAIELMTNNDHRWRNMGMTRVELEARALGLVRPRLIDVIDIVYRYHLASSGKRRFGDKTPVYFDIVPELDRLYPGAKFIHVVRDGRDVAMSFIDLGWQGDPRFYQREFEWLRALHCRDHYRELALDPQILDIKYEDLVTEPEPTIRRICEFLEEDFEPGMLDPTTRIASVPVAERAIHSRLSEPLSAAAIGKWRTKLSAAECFLMEACLQDDLKRWGYELRFSAAGWQPALRASGWLLHHLGPFLARLVPALQRRGYLSRSIYL